MPGFLRKISFLDYVSCAAFLIILAHGISFGYRSWLANANGQLVYQDLALSHCGVLYTDYTEFQEVIANNPDCELNSLGAPATTEWMEYTQAERDALSTVFSNDGSLVVYDELDTQIEEGKILVTINPNNNPEIDEEQVARDSISHLMDEFKSSVTDVKFLFSESFLTYDYIVEYTVGPGVDVAAFATHIDANPDFVDDAGSHIVLVNPNVIFSNLVLEEENEASNLGFSVQSYDDGEVDQWHLDFIGYNDIVDCLPALSTPITVGVVDNGFDLVHPDLDQRIVAEYDQANKDDDAQVPFYEKAWNHGTKEAGLIGASHNDIGVRGIVPDAKLVVVKSTKDAANGKDITNGIEAIATAYELGAEVINLSRGGFGNVSMLERVTKKIAGKGVILVAAAGNYNKSQLFYPAAYDWVIGVGAVDQEGNKASFSNYGPWVDVSAPGVDMLTTDLDNTYNKYNGTSESSPVTAGAIALALSHGLTWDDLRNNFIPTNQEGMGEGILNLGFMCDAIQELEVVPADIEEHGSADRFSVGISLTNNKAIDMILFAIVFLGILNGLIKVIRYEIKGRKKKANIGQI